MPTPPADMMLWVSAVGIRLANALVLGSEPRMPPEPSRSNRSNRRSRPSRSNRRRAGHRVGELLGELLHEDVLEAERLLVGLLGLRVAVADVGRLSAGLIGGSVLMA